MPKPVDPDNWRYRLAQGLLRLLYGRKQHSISPWHNAGLAVSCIFHLDGKVVLALRRGNIENAGKYGLIGGFMDLDKEEEFGTALVREVWEETGWRIDPAPFTRESIKVSYVTYQRPFIEMKRYTVLCQYWWHPITQAELDALQPQEETAAFRLVNTTEFEELAKDGLCPFADSTYAIRHFFANHSK